MDNDQQLSVTAGLDEAGRGCLAGPVYAAAVILPDGFHHPMLTDSKQLTAKKRNLLREVIEKEALAWSVASITPSEIDEINILQASIRAMHRAIDNLSIKPSLLLIDGHRFNPYPDIPHRCEIKGDARFDCIAAASILAKTHRDEYLAKLHDLHPEYEWIRNKGYPTRAHRRAILQHGITRYHRKSFRLVDEQLELNFEGDDR